LGFFFAALISVYEFTTCTIRFCLVLKNLNVLKNTKNEVTRLACKAVYTMSCVETGESKRHLKICNNYNPACVPKQVAPLHGGIELGI
jgi:hypothetical protein